MRTTMTEKQREVLMGLNKKGLLDVVIGDTFVSYIHKETGMLMLRIQNAQFAKTVVGNSAAREKCAE